MEITSLWAKLLALVSPSDLAWLLVLWMLLRFFERREKVHETRIKALQEMGNALTKLTTLIEVMVHGRRD